MTRIGTFIGPHEMACALEPWDALIARAGHPSLRVFDETTRLFGASVPAVRLWHDSAAWHPFANQVWLLLEAMQIPYTRSTVPLRHYKKATDHTLLAQFEAELPCGAKPDAVPYVQLSSSPSCAGHADWSDPLRERTSLDLLGALTTKFPEHALMPRTPKRRAYAEALLEHTTTLQSVLYGVLGGRASSSAQRRYIAAMDEWDDAVSGVAKARFALGSRAFPDDGDGHAERFGGDAAAGPFLFGERACAVDLLLLPLLERCEANVPHPVVGGLPALALERWPALAALLEAGRSPEWTGSVAALLSDSITTSGVRLAVTGAHAPLPAPPSNLVQAALVAAACDGAARLDAAARLAHKGTPIARFAVAGYGTGRPRPAGHTAGRADPRSELVAAVDSALRATASLLLQPAEPQLLASNAQALATELLQGAPNRQTGDAPLAVGVADALVFLAMNTGVPRDMDAPAARALRAHLMLAAGAVGNTNGRR